MMYHEIGSKKAAKLTKILFFEFEMDYTDQEGEEKKEECYQYFIKSYWDNRWFQKPKNPTELHAMYRHRDKLSAKIHEKLDGKKKKDLLLDNLQAFILDECDKMLDETDMRA